MYSHSPIIVSHDFEYPSKVKTWFGVKVRFGNLESCLRNVESLHCTQNEETKEFNRSVEV